MQTPHRGAVTTWAHRGEGDELCVNKFKRVAVHDDCAIVWSVCPHGVLGWKEVKPDKLYVGRRR